MEELNNQYIKAYFQIEKVLSKHINIKKSDISWYLMLVRDACRGYFYFEQRRDELTKDVKKPFVYDYQKLTKDELIEVLTQEINCELFLDQCDYKADFKLIDRNKAIIKFLENKEIGKKWKN